MALTKLTADVENVSHLSDLPNAEQGLTAAEVKAEFDKAAADIKYYINNILTEEINLGLGKAFTVTFPSGETSYDLETMSYGLNANTIVFCQPEESSQHRWNECEIRCSEVTAGKLSFTATTAPDSNVIIKVFVMN